MTKELRNATILLLVTALTGCSSILTSTANRHVTPVVKFLNMYHDSEGEFPETLESLASATPKAQNLKLKEATNVGTVWTINYRRTSPQEYAISFNHVHYDVLYKNGEHVATRKAFFR